MATRKNQNAAGQEKDSGTKPEDTQAQQQPGGQKPAAQSNERKVVTFLRPFSRYTRGDIAGFEPKEAARLVKKKVAVEGTKLPAQTDNQDDEPKA